MPEQTFIRPVPSIVEVLSKAARKAGDLSTREMVVTIEVRYLGLQVRVSCFRHTSVYKHNITIGWLDLSECIKPYDLIEKSMEESVEAVRRQIREDINAAS